MIRLIPFSNLLTLRVNLDVLVSTTFSHRFAARKSRHQRVSINQPRSVCVNTQIRGEQEKLEEFLSVLGAHEKKQTGSCIMHLFCLEDRDSAY